VKPFVEGSAASEIFFLKYGGLMLPIRIEDLWFGEPEFDVAAMFAKSRFEADAQDAMMGRVVHAEGGWLFHMGGNQVRTAASQTMGVFCHRSLPFTSSSCR
jgi:hypothetical protein